LVLRFQSRSGDPEQEYFADGIVEDIIHRAVAIQIPVRDRAQFELHLLLCRPCAWRMRFAAYRIRKY